MTNSNSKKRSVLGIIAIILCFVMLLGATWAWFTDIVTNSGNKIESGGLKVDLELYDATAGTWASVANSADPIFTLTNWQPTDSVVQVLRVTNEDTADLQWYATIQEQNDTKGLSDVIDVYVMALTDPADTTGLIADANKVGTLTECITGNFDDVLRGTLGGGSENNVNNSYTFGVALVMQSTAENEYELAEAKFDITVHATQAEDVDFLPASGTP